MPKCLLRILVLLLVFCGGFTMEVNKRERKCCGYSRNSSQSSICHHSNGCIVMSPGNSNLQTNIKNLSYKSLAVEECQIKADSKLEGNKGIEDESSLECLSQTFNGEDIRQAQVIYGIVYGLKDETLQDVEYGPHRNIEIDNTIPLPFSIHPYILKYPRATELPALEVRVAYGGDRQWHSSSSSWTQLRFRILNRNHCNGIPPESLSSCTPRCVSVNRQHEQQEENNESTANNGETRPRNVGS